MLSEVMKYSALSAKVKAMYGKLLNESQWKKIEEIRTIPELAAFLKSVPGWSEAAKKLPGGTLTANALESALRLQIGEERKRLFQYVSQEDREYFAYTVYEEEYRRILENLRRLTSPLGKVLTPPSPALIKKSKLDLEALDTATSFSEICKAAEHTLYGPALHRVLLRLDTPYPEYRSISVMMENIYYEKLYRFLLRRYKGSGKTDLVQHLGEEADLLNLLHILRLHRYFPGSLEHADEFLIPVHRRLTKDFAAELIAAPNETAAVQLLLQSYWGKFFANYRGARLEELFYQAKVAQNARLLKTSVPGVAVIEEYLQLKELEEQRLLQRLMKLHYSSLG